MQDFLIPILTELAIFAFGGLLFWLIVARVINRERALRKSPFTKELLKAPGESCLRKIDELNDSYWESFSILFTGIMFIVGIVFGSTLPAFKSPLTIGLGIITALAGAIFLMIRIRRNIRERINYRLGFDGERQTAQALQPLLAEGYEIFHDLEFKDATGKPFNIDHVLLGPAGVIVVETKTRHKDAAAKGKEAVKVRYDGKRITFPKGYETAWLDQTLANAKHLSRELYSYTGEKVFVKAAISIPGWLVEPPEKEVNPVVYNPEWLRKWVLELPAVSMDTPQRNRIRGFLSKPQT